MFCRRLSKYGLFLEGSLLVSEPAPELSATNEDLKRADESRPVDLILID